MMNSWISSGLVVEGPGSLAKLWERQFLRRLTFCRANVTRDTCTVACDQCSQHASLLSGTIQ